MKKICKQCKNIFITPRSKSKYCSRACRDKAKIIPRFCLRCGKEYKHNNKNVRFCSIECYHKNRTKIVAIICESCGNEFKPHRNDGQKYCSRKCFFKGSASRKETKIEKELYSFLDNKDIEYEKQYYLGFTIPDAFIPSLNLCIYADGIYWHSYKINKGKDYRQNKKLSKLGYNFIRLKEQKKSFSLNLEPLKLYLQVQL